jgi:CxxC motif-containing protein (DUF1111 family)
LVRGQAEAQVVLMNGFARVSAYAAFLSVALTGCELLTPGAPLDEDVLDGTIEGLTPAQTARHLAGDAEFGRRFSVSTGLGPVFVAASCEQCHVGDGKGHPVFNLTRFGRYGPGTEFDAMVSEGGPQLQHRAVPGYPPEVVPAGASGVAVFTPPAVTGLGYLDAVDDATLIALADPGDANRDGISGRLQIHSSSDLIETVIQLEGASSPDVHARGTRVEGGYIGRFGKKALAVNLLQQTVGAYHEDMGITSDLLSEDIFNPIAGNRTSDATPDPEASSSAVSDVVFYLKTLKAPIRREADHPDVLAGEALFHDIGCTGCHVPTLRTGRSEIAVLDRVEFHPYTDLLLHDMGPELDDGYTEGRALSAEWRTPPLWGLGLQESFQGSAAFYLHDGRAHTLEQAIELHGGEAALSRDGFRRLPADARSKLIRFLRSL